MQLWQWCDNFKKNKFFGNPVTRCWRLNLNSVIIKYKQNETIKKCNGTYDSPIWV